MMIEPSINELDKMVDSRYSLVCAVAKRAREIAAGAEPLVSCPVDKDVSVAAMELCANKVRITDKPPVTEEAEEEIADA